MHKFDDSIEQTKCSSVPFDKNACYIPPKMTEDKESNLYCFSKEIKDVLEEEAKSLKNSEAYKDTLLKAKKAKAFLNKNDLECIRSDKTNRLVISESQTLESRNQKLLQDKDTYKLLSKSKSESIEKQANKLIKSILPSTELNREINRLLSTATQPANFFSFVKDHKITDTEYPVRPIASVKNTPVEKIDWIIARILTNALPFVPSHLTNTEQLLDLLKNVKVPAEDNLIFVSLDVEKLYPSIPIELGIECNLKFLEDNWQSLDTFGLSLEQVGKLLKFICYNYEIQYNDAVFKQVAGVPMGAHFAPAFAIIFMHNIETSALEKLNFKPLVFRRFIDDVVLGPVQCEKEVLDHISETFNSIHPKIKFTMESHEHTEWLPFLDTKIRIQHAKIEYSWHRKPFHSDIILRKDSFVPHHVKSNFIRNRINNIRSRCSNDNYKEEKVQEF
ncbi:MAG: reverse transcriptase domain-containing protein, partial [Pseudomonadota bacterium]